MYQSNKPTKSKSLLAHIRWASNLLTEKLNSKEFQIQCSKWVEDLIQTSWPEENPKAIRSGRGSSHTFAKFKKYRITSLLAFRPIVYRSGAEDFIILTILFGSGQDDPAIEIVFRRVYPTYYNMRPLRFKKHRKAIKRDTLEVLYSPEYEPMDYFIQIAIYLIQKGFLSLDSILPEFANYIFARIKDTDLNDKSVRTVGYFQEENGRHFTSWNKAREWKKWRIDLREVADDLNILKKALHRIVNSYYLPFTPTTFIVYARKMIVGVLKDRKRKRGYRTTYYKARVNPDREMRWGIIKRITETRGITREGARKWLYRELKKGIPLDRINVEIWRQN